jgi:hypothetical protein
LVWRSTFYREETMDGEVFTLRAEVVLRGEREERWGRLRAFLRGALQALHMLLRGHTGAGEGGQLTY